MSETKPIQSLLRGIDILEMLSDSPHGLRLSEIADAMDLKMPTVHNLVRTLASRGLVEKLSSNQYAVGPCLSEMNDRVRDNQQHLHAETIVRRLSTLHKKITVNYTIASGNRLVIRLRMSPDRPKLMQHPVGQSHSIYSTASGIAFLAFAQADQIALMRQSQPFHDVGIRLWDSAELLENCLEETRKQGYAETTFKDQDLYRVASPVFDSNEMVVGYVGISLPAADIPKRAEQKKLALEIFKAAKDLSDLINAS